MASLQILNATSEITSKYDFSVNVGMLPHRLDETMTSRSKVKIQPMSRSKHN